MSIKGRLYSTYHLGIAMENNVRKDAVKSISHLALLKTLCRLIVLAASLLRMGFPQWMMIICNTG